MKRREQLYEEKAKKVYATDDPELLIVSYKDDATAFNGAKRGTIEGKGVINNRMSNILMRYLQTKGVATHFVEEINDRDTIVKKVAIVPLEVIVRNISAGSFAKRYGVEEGIVFDAPTVNKELQGLWGKCGVTLVDFKLEFGRLADGTIVLADEISPDTCRLWDSATKEKLDKDRFRRDLGGVEDAYRTIMGRLEQYMEQQK